MTLDVETVEKIAKVLMPLLKNNQDKKKLLESSSLASENIEPTK